MSLCKYCKVEITTKRTDRKAVFCNKHCERAWKSINTKKTYWMSPELMEEFTDRRMLILLAAEGNIDAQRYLYKKFRLKSFLHPVTKKEIKLRAYLRCEE